MNKLEVKILRSIVRGEAHFASVSQTFGRTERRVAEKLRELDLV